MDAVKAFNNELSGLYEVKPPISKAKMTSITRGAIKAIKFYKHVVQSVEKFILKCKPEYKVPGLYVIDSIVRQSRHQFGSERDVFAPRFAKNVQQTFVNLFKCPAEDKSKVIRVLNLWQKNQVFPAEVIQPLFDLADPNNPIYREQLISGQSNGLANQSSISKGSPAIQKSPTKGPSQIGNQLVDANISGVSNNPNIHPDPTTLAQLQQLQKLLQRQANDSNTKVDGQPVHFDRKLLDFDYDDDEEDDPSPKPPVVANNSVPTIDPVGSLLSNPEVLRHLQTLQQLKSSQSQVQEIDVEKLRKLQELQQQEEKFAKHLAQTVPNLPFAAECELKPPPINNSPAIMQNYYMGNIQDMTIPPPGYNKSYEITQQEEGTLDSEIQFMSTNDSGDLEVITLDRGDSSSQSPRPERYQSSRRRRSRSRDRSRDKGRDRDRRSRRSRSRSRSRDRRRRSRTRDRDRERDREKEVEKEKDRERDKERRKRGLPPIKKENLSVCSTTLWVGHLSKLVHQEELSDTFGEFGDVVSIDLIPPRGCAFIVMHRRQDATRCLQKLKNHKMQGKAITVAWAPGKGVKGKELKDYWEVDLGVSYIPWSKLKPDVDIEMLEDGGMIDEETLPDWLKNKQIQQTINRIQLPPQPSLSNKIIDVSVNSAAAALTPTPVGTIDTSQPPPIPGGGLLQPPGLPLPIVSPFQLNNRLLGPVGMNIPPGMMPNVPIGVPPPNMPHGPMMTNQLLGISSPFAQGPPGLLPRPLSLATAEKPAATGTENIGTNSESVLGLSFTMMHHQPTMTISSQHEDNMDVEMEDASERVDKQPALSDQLLAALGQQNNENALSVAVSRLHAVTNQRTSSSGGGNDNYDHDRHGERTARSREQDRDGDRGDHKDKSGRQNSRDRSRDNRDRDRRDERRDRSNRWGDRDRKERDRSDNDRRDHEDKSLNDRLREMAHQSGFSNRGDRPRRSNSENRDSYDNTSNNQPQSLMERPIFQPPDLRDIKGLDHQSMEHRFRPPPDDFDNHRRRDHDNWMDGPPEFDPPSRPLLDHDNGSHRMFFNNNRDNNVIRPLFNDDSGPRHQHLDHEEHRFARRDRMDDPPMGMCDEMIRGPGFGPGSGSNGPRSGMGMGGPRPDFWGGGLPRPMRGHGPENFFGRGRPPGPSKFLPRTGPMRGPRPPGPHGMRPGFQPRFEGPSEFFRGGPPMYGPRGPLGPHGPPGSYGPPNSFIPPDDSLHMRHRRRDDRRNFRAEIGGNDGGGERQSRSDRRTRWGNSPRAEDVPKELPEIPGDDSNELPLSSESAAKVETGEETNENMCDGDGGRNSTPLRDELQEELNDQGVMVLEEEINKENKNDGTSADDGTLQE